MLNSLPPPKAGPAIFRIKHCIIQQRRDRTRVFCVCVYLIIRNSTTQDDNNKQKSSLDSNTLDVLDISSDESDKSNFCPVGHKRARLLSSSDE